MATAARRLTHMATAARRLHSMRRRFVNSSAGFVNNLVHHVDVKPLDNNLPRNNVLGVYVGHSVDLGWGRVYGGQTMAQGLAACQHLAGPERSVHHFGCHFLAAGDTSLDIRFEAEALSSGRSFSAIHVRALQKASPILAMTASLQTPENGFDHQECTLRPEWGRPEGLKSYYDHMEPFLTKHDPKRLHRMKAMFGSSSPFELRPNFFHAPWDASARDTTHRALWIRARAPLPDVAAVHERLLTYISDWGLLETATWPHPTATWRPELQLASLSHSIHFHRPFRLDQQWLCHVMYSPSSSGGRGSSLGEFWSEDGVLVASTAQEGLMRLRHDRQPKTPRAA